jgi:hypothetical protein
MYELLTTSQEENVVRISGNSSSNCNSKFLKNTPEATGSVAQEGEEGN